MLILMYPSPPPPSGNQDFVFSVSLSLCFANKFTCIFFFRLLIQMTLYAISLSLSGLLH